MTEASQANRTGFHTNAAGRYSNKPHWLIAGMSGALIAGTLLTSKAEGQSTTTGIAPSAQTGGVEEIVVTARRREENAQDVPIALTAIGAEDISGTGTYTLSQLQQVVPSLQVFSFNPRNTNINIRGLGSNIALANDGLESGVGVYLDQVYLGRVGISQFELVDLARVEVLRGPQGTLFGKNTTAGAVNIASKAPNVDEPELFGEATLGNHGFHQLKASVSGPLIGDTLAGRLSISDTHRDGFIDNVTTGREVQDFDNFTTRGQLLFVPNEDLAIRVIGDYGRQKLNCCINVGVGVFTQLDNGAPVPDNFLVRTARLGYAPLPFAPFDRRTDADSHFQANMSQWGISAEVDWSFGGHDLTSVTAYRDWNWDPANDGDGIGLPVTTVAQQVNRQQQFSQELRVASIGDRRIDYVAGLYYFWQVVDGFGSFAYGSAAPAWFFPPTSPVAPVVAEAALNGFTAESTSTPATRSYAAFGQAVWHINDALDLTGGLRFTHERRWGSYSQVQTGGPSLAGLTPTQAATAQGIRNNFNRATSYSSEVNDDSLSGIVNLSYRLAPQVLSYALYSRGNKSGGLNLTNLPAGVDPVVDPETIDHFEVGVKSQFFDNVVLVNVAAYWTNISDYQTSILQQNAVGGSFLQYISNIEKARSRGFEIDTRWSLNDRFGISASGSYTDAEYVSYTNGPCPIEVSLAPAQCDLSGQPLSGAPRWSGSIAVDGSQPVFDFLELHGRLDYSHRSGFFTAVSNSRYSRVDDYGLLNLRVGVRDFDQRWDVSLWARNLLNKQYFQTISGGNTGLVSGMPGEPLTVGVTLSGRF